MGIGSSDLRQYVITPVLQKLGEQGDAAALLLQITAMHESDIGTTLKNGKYSGIYGMDKGTHRRVWDTWLVHDPELASRIRGIASQHQFLLAPHQELVTNLAYATAITWCCYRMNQLQLPETASVENLTHCWQTHYRPDASSQAVTNFATCAQRLLNSPDALRIRRAA